MKNVKFASISDQLINTAIIMDMMFNTEMIVKDMDGGKEDMTEKRFTTNGYKIYDTFHDGIHWLVNQVEANEIVDKMNNLDSKARERSKALSKLQKENEQLKQRNEFLKKRCDEYWEEAGLNNDYYD